MTVSFQDHPFIIYHQKCNSLYNFPILSFWERYMFDLNIHTSFFMISKCAITDTLELNATENVGTV